MYKWYQNAAICYAYLKDVELQDEDETENSGKEPEPGIVNNTHTTPKVVSRKRYHFDQAILKSRWFTRGWTLQELLAPRQVYFYNAQWQHIGIKFRGYHDRPGYKPPKLRTRDFVPLIHQATGIPVAVLDGREQMQSYSVGQRMSWAAKRKTTREEDQAYCLMGLFEVNMPMLYGEGNAAFLRLLDEIMKRTDDHSLFAYNYHHVPTFVAAETGSPKRSLTAADYDGCAHVERLRSGGNLGGGLDSLSGSNNNLVFNNTMEHHVMTNKGLFIELDTLTVPELQGMLVGRLNCSVTDETARGLSEDRVVVLPLYQMSRFLGSKIVFRTLGVPLVDLPLWLFDALTTITRPLYISNDPLEVEMGRGSEPLLEVASHMHPFAVAELYPPVIEFSRLFDDYRDPEGSLTIFSYPTDDLPRQIYIRLRSERRNLSLLVKLKIEYDEWEDPGRAECSVAPMPVGKSLLELLLIDEYPEPYGPVGTVGAYDEDAKDRVEYTTNLRYRSNFTVHVKVALRLGYCIRLAVAADEINAADLAEDEYEELVAL